MSSVHPAVDFVLDLLGPVVEGVATDYDHRNGGDCILKRVDRDNCLTYGGDESVDMSTPVHKREAKLKTGSFVGVSYVNDGGSLVGTEPMQNSDVVLGVMIQGMTHREYGHVDPNGENGIPWNELLDRIRDAIWAELQYPDPDDSNVSYRHLDIGNEDAQSAGWKDFYQHSLDVTFTGYKELNQ